ncbi:MAG TPA: cellulase family glycosylhydrolase [Candidatus Woesebacteria bacterium]|nr:cellulase family glycosylhydrolase [Candidatus Woesebacteria bacterium]HPJ16677.1 cellulase family glycosylhydrolase [Candidatus Woesebacteria bacterium]
MNKHTIGFCLLIGWLLIGAKPSFAQTADLSDFVRRSGNQLTLNGKPFVFVGVNRDNAFTDNSANSCGDGGEYPELYLNTMFDNLKSTCNGANTNMAMRVWAFQSYTNYNATTKTVDFSQIDKVVDKAEKAGVRLIMTLENQWGDCTKCINNSGDCRKLNTWYKTGYKLWKKGVSGNNGYNYPLTYKEYVGKIVERYKDRKIIMMWQLMNEAESETASLGSDPTSMYNFTQDMANYIKSIDPNHLISVGTIGTENPGIEYEKLHSIASVDILENHDYGKPISTNPSLHHSYVDGNIAIANKLNKPIFMGEGGIKKGQASSLANRASMFDKKIKAYVKQGGDGYLIWSYTEGKLDPYYQSAPYDFNSTDPICPVMKNISF